jgi:hypothetical protein
MSFYVCNSFDEYNPKTGYFILKVECIEWDENISGIWHGPKYSSKEECYSKSICGSQTANMDGISVYSNNYCNISISNISIVNLSSDSLTFELELPTDYENTYLEYAFYDIDFKLLKDFTRLSGTPDILPHFSTLNIPLDVKGICNIAFRLVKPCDFEELSGSEESGSEESGSDGSGSGGGGGDEGSGISWQLFDLSSWENISSVLPMKAYLDAAAANWNNILKYNDDVFQVYKQTNPTWDGLALVYYEEINDPNAGYIAACGPIGTIDILNNDPLNIKTNAVTFQLYVNTYYNDPGWQFTDSDWINVITHELGHALGIGIYWDLYNNYWIDGTKYTNASAAYNYIIGDLDNNRTLVPLEDAGGIGTQSSHWENNDRLDSYPNSDGYNYPGCSFDIMIGFFTVGNPKPISNLSKDFLIDIGYESTGFPVESLPLLQSQIQTKETNSITINNMCGTSKKCGCDTNQKLGTVDIINNKFILP